MFVRTRMSRLSLVRSIFPLLCSAACAAGENGFEQGASPSDSAPDGSTEQPSGSAPDAGADEDSQGDGDGDSNGDGDGDDGKACVGVTARAELERLPVDIIWVVDNSSSMSPAIDEVTSGINALAERIGDSDLDFRVIMLSLRGKGSVKLNGSNRYAVCVPKPLAGDDNCGNGERFFHSSVDVRSTQPLEQLLGTLGQTQGYRAGEERGGEPWAQHLREGASKTIVVVSDDNSRLSADQFEHFSAGANPNNRNYRLPDGVLEASWQGLFEGYVFHGLYGWGSASNSADSCSYPDGTEPTSSGPTYSDLVERTGGVRAQICDGSAAWGPFFERIATAVESHARIACDLTIPPAPGGSKVDPDRVNVAIRVSGASPITLGKVAESKCGPEGGWHYDDEDAPSHVVLCPASCELAQQGAGTEGGGIDVEFGCATLVL